MGSEIQRYSILNFLNEGIVFEPNDEGGSWVKYADHVAAMNALSGVPDPEAELRRLRAIEVAAKEAHKWLSRGDASAITEAAYATHARNVLRTALALHGQGGGE